MSLDNFTPQESHDKKGTQQEIKDVIKAYEQIAQDGLLTGEDIVHIDGYLKETGDLNDTVKGNLDSLLKEVVDLSLKYRGFLISSQQEADSLKAIGQKLGIENKGYMVDYDQLTKKFPGVDKFVLHFNNESVVGIRNHDESNVFTNLLGIIQDGEVVNLSDELLRRIKYTMKTKGSGQFANMIGDIHINDRHILTKDVISLIEKFGLEDSGIKSFRDENGELSVGLVLALGYGNPATRKILFGGR